MKIGILGGTFDPPHDAHLKIAERSIEQFYLDKVIFIPSGNPWQKKETTSFIHRYEMTKLLIKNSEQLEISKIENSEDTPSYTYETLTKLNLPKENLFFILGSDTAMKIRTWKNYKDLSDIILFDGKGYDQSIGFDHNLLNEVPDNINKMIAGDIKTKDLIKFKDKQYIIDISGHLESEKSVKDINKIDKFLNTVHNINS